MSEQVTDTLNQDVSVDGMATPADKVDNAATSAQKTDMELTDSQAAKLRRSVEAEFEKKILSQLNIDSLDKLEHVKTAYEKSLTADEKAAKELKELQTAKASADSQISDYKIANSVLSQIAGKDPDDISDIVKMAKGLIDDDTPIDSAIKKVMGMMAQQQPAQQKPSGFGLLQPDQPKGTGLEEYKKMSGQEKIKLKQENPKLYEQFKKQLGF